MAHEHLRPWGPANPIKTSIDIDQNLMNLNGNKNADNIQYKKGVWYMEQNHTGSEHCDLVGLPMMTRGFH